MIGEGLMWFPWIAFEEFKRRHVIIPNSDKKLWKGKSADKGPNLILIIKNKGIQCTVSDVFSSCFCISNFTRIHKHINTITNDQRGKEDIKYGDNLEMNTTFFLKQNYIYHHKVPIGFSSYIIFQFKFFHFLYSAANKFSCLWPSRQISCLLFVCFKFSNANLDYFL